MNKRRTTRHGFTLVELLVVLTIIGILMAILIPTIWVVLARSRNVRIGVEIDGMAKALEAYKLDYGEYPPNFDDMVRLTNHLSLRFPNMRDPAEIQKFTDQIGKIGPHEALVFWLGGRTSMNPLGLVDNKVYPISGPGEPKVYFSFDQSRFRDANNNQWPEYVGAGTMDSPYVYFEGRSYSKYQTTPLPPATPGTPFPVGIIDGTDRGTVQPLKTKSPTNYQIISAGLDGVFDSAPVTYTYPDGPYNPPAKDNLASFTEGKTFQDARP